MTVSPALEPTLADYDTADEAMRECLELARAAARTDLPVLILGESGTGKTLLAHAIHRSSVRARFAFVAFNAAALSDTLLDSQLFGHERGAFTGATMTRWHLGFDEVGTTVAAFTLRTVGATPRTPAGAPRELFETVEARGADPRDVEVLARDRVWHRPR